MRLTALQVLQDGPDGRVQLTVGDEQGNQATYVYAGSVSSTVTSHNSGYLEVSLNVHGRTPEILAANSSKSRFDG